MAALRTAHKGQALRVSLKSHRYDVREAAFPLELRNVRLETMGLIDVRWHHAVPADVTPWEHH